MDNEDSKIIQMAVIGFIAALTLVSIIVFCVLSLHNNGGIAGWRAETIAGTLSLCGLGGLVGMTVAYMDTRNSEQKDKFKLEKRKEQNRHKEIMRKLGKSV